MFCSFVTSEEFTVKYSLEVEFFLPLPKFRISGFDMGNKRFVRNYVWKPLGKQPVERPSRRTGMSNSFKMRLKRNGL